MHIYMIIKACILCVFYVHMQLYIYTHIYIYVCDIPQLKLPHLFPATQVPSPRAMEEAPRPRHHRNANALSRPLWRYLRAVRCALRRNVEVQILAVRHHRTQPAHQKRASKRLDNAFKPSDSV